MSGRLEAFQHDAACLKYSEGRHIGSKKRLARVLQFNLMPVFDASFGCRADRYGGLAASPRSSLGEARGSRARNALPLQVGPDPKLVSAAGIRRLRFRQKNTPMLISGLDKKISTLPLSRHATEPIWLSCGPPGSGSGYPGGGRSAPTAPSACVNWAPAPPLSSSSKPSAGSQRPLLAFCTT